MTDENHDGTPVGPRVSATLLELLEK